MYYSRNSRAFVLLLDFPLEVRVEPLCPPLLNFRESAVRRGSCRQSTRVAVT